MVTLSKSPSEPIVIITLKMVMVIEIKYDAPILILGSAPPNLVFLKMCFSLVVK
jgi:hypothetical protein